MGKQIDWTQPLSAEDRAWAEQFPALYGGQLEQNLAEFPPEEAETLDGDDVEDEPYDRWTLKDLQDEIKRRNNEESAGLPVPSKKADAVKVLEQNDADTEEQPPA